jgi:hypothetical protein
MQDTKSNKQSLEWRLIATVLCLVAAVFVPLVIVSLYSYYDNSHYETSRAVGMLVYLVALASGGFFVCMLPLRLPVRLVCLCIYVPVAFVGLFFYSLYFWVEVLHNAIT